MARIQGGRLKQAWFMHWTEGIHPACKKLLVVLIIYHYHLDSSRSWRDAERKPRMVPLGAAESGLESATRLLPQTFPPRRQIQHARPTFDRLDGTAPIVARRQVLAVEEVTGLHAPFPPRPAHFPRRPSWARPWTKIVGPRRGHRGRTAGPPQSPGHSAPTKENQRSVYIHTSAGCHVIKYFLRADTNAPPFFACLEI